MPTVARGTMPSIQALVDAHGLAIVYDGMILDPARVVIHGTAANRWAAFTDDELMTLYARIEDSERIGNLKSGGPRLAVEIQAELERRRT